MGKYSSDSDSNDYYNSKKRSSKVRHRQSSLESSSSSDSYHRRQKRKSSKHKGKLRKRSRSRERYHRRSRSPSSNRSRRRSTSRTRDHKDRHSRDHRSRSRDRRRSRSSERFRRARKSQSPKSSNNPRFVDLTSDTEDSTRQKLTNADPEIEAKLGKHYSATSTDFRPMSDEDDNDSTLNDASKFLQFSAAPKKVPDNIVIDLKSQTILVPKVEIQEEKLTVFHPKLMPNEASRIDKWVKDLYQFRQKTLKGEFKL